MKSKRPRESLREYFGSSEKNANTNVLMVQLRDGCQRRTYFIRELQLGIASAVIDRFRLFTDFQSIHMVAICPLQQFYETGPRISSSVNNKKYA